MENWDKLKNLQGYNFKKDKFVEPPKQEQEKNAATVKCFYSFTTAGDVS